MFPVIIAIVVVAVVLVILAILDYYKPRIILALKKGNVDTVKDLKNLAESERNLTDKKGGNVETEVAKNLKTMKQTDNAADEIRKNL